MDLEPTDDQLALAAGLARLCADRVTPEARRAAMALPGAVDRELWRALGDIGAFALAVPADRGGLGLGLAEASLVFEQLGRAAVPGPVVGTFLAAGLPLGPLAGAALTGDAVVGLSPEGRPALVEHRAALDALLVVGPSGVVLTPRPEGGDGPVDRPLDPLTPIDVVPDLPPGEPVGGPDLAARLRRDAGLLSAAIQVGLAGAAVAMATEHAGSRTQFGRAIGSFQALKHLLADAQVGVEVARSAVQAAAVAVDEGGDGADRAAHAARIVASGAADRAARACVQVHGGMGFTWDLDAHLFLKRTLVLDAGIATPEGAIDALAALL